MTISYWPPPTISCWRDYATPVQLSLRLDYRSRRTLWSSSYGGSFQMYRDASELNSSEQAVDIRFREVLTRNLTLFGHESFAKVPTTDAFTLGGIPFIRVGARTNRSRGRARGQIEPYDDVGAGVHAHDRGLRVSSPPRCSVGRRIYAPGICVVGTAAVAAIRSWSRISPAAGGIEEGDDRFSIQDASVTAQYRLTPNMGLSGFAGLSHIGAGLQHPERTGPSAGITISRQLTRAVLISAGYERTFIPSWAFGGTFQTQELFATLRVPFARNKAYVEGRTRLIDAEALQCGEPNLRSLWVGTVLGYRATRWLSSRGTASVLGRTRTHTAAIVIATSAGFACVTAKPMKLG